MNPGNTGYNYPGIGLRGGLNLGAWEKRREEESNQGDRP